MDAPGPRTPLPVGRPATTSAGELVLTFRFSGRGPVDAPEAGGDRRAPAPDA
ncbi:hypothetical protein AB0E96_03960 [Kitasatospora sp. NPDC036755]|uniref:hypothetical protein n=1 Tax=Kitasatospora sp. NPDC036755 TaxID=3154600 RepID=UPI0033C0CF7F